MYEDAQRIFEYLPIEPGEESRYIKQLRDTLQILTNAEEDALYFSIVPFHLLFMLAVQYKVYRIAAFDKNFYSSKVDSGACRTYGTENKIQVRQNIPLDESGEWDITKTSVKSLSLINEKDLFNFFEIIELDKTVIEKAQWLIDNRNDHLHANGNIEENSSQRIQEYLEILEAIQIKYSQKKINTVIQGNWADEITEDLNPLKEFFEEKFLYSQFSPSDFGDMIDGLLIAEHLTIDQWKEIIDIGLGYCYKKTIFQLQYIEASSASEERVSYITETLNNYGEESSILTLDEAQDLGII